MSLKTHHRAAIAHPCLFAFETMHSRFRWLFGGVSVIVTVNSGYE